MLFPSGSALVDYSGFSFPTTDGTQYNVYTSNGFLRESVSGFDDGANSTFSLTPTTPTPEPSALLLLGSGTPAAASAVRRRMAR